MPLGDENNTGPWPFLDRAPPTKARRAAGKKAQDRGKVFEREIRKGHRPAFVYLQPTPPPWHYVREGKALKAVVEEVGVPDFHGGVHGRAVVFDAKATGEARWSLKHLTKEQAEHLDAAMGRQVIAGVLLRFDSTQAVYWLPWPMLGPVWWAWHGGTSGRGDASLTEAGAGWLGVKVVGLRWWEGVR
jgi:penicillin-binding protein-related factor A (putative recombinase)